MENKDKSLQKDLENILETVAKSENIRNYKIFIDSECAKGDGFLSVFFTGEILNTDNGQTTEVAIKKSPTDGFTSNFGNNTAYGNEISFYSELFPELDRFQREQAVKNPFNNIPKYLSGNIDSKNMFIAMENLKTAGYELFDKKKYVDDKHLPIMFKTYAKFHALSFAYRQQNEEKYNHAIKHITDIFAVMTEPSENSGTITAMAESFLSALEFFDPITEADTLTKLKAVGDIKEAIREVRPYTSKYKCFSHGDCWSNNMLFKYKQSGEVDDMKLLDFQFPGTSTPVQDLSFFFYSGASKQDLDKVDYYLDLYYNHFTNFSRELGVNPDEMFSFEELKMEWKRYARLGFFLGLKIWTTRLMDKAEIIEVLNQKGLPLDKYWELWADRIREIRKGSEYKEKARNLCIHAVEYGLI